MSLEYSDGFSTFTQTKVMKLINNTGFNHRRTCGVYRIICIPTGDSYIGSTKANFRQRKSNHEKFLRQGLGINTKIQALWTQYREENFSFEVLEVTKAEEAVIREQYYFDTLKPTLIIKPKATNTSKTNLGKKFTKSHIEKLRQKASLYRHTDNKDIHENQIKINKEGANKFKLINQETKEEKKFNSSLELESFFNRKTGLNNYYHKVYKNWLIIPEKLQKKSVTLIKQEEVYKFESFEKCDKFLNKWRGYTSVNNLRGITEFCGYNVKFE